MKDAPQANAERQANWRERKHATGWVDARSRDGDYTQANKIRQQSRPFVAIDGEGINKTPTDQRYAILAASDGSYTANIEGLSTEQCLQYLLDLKDANPKAYFVGFFFSYDVNMILRDLQKHPKTLELLRRKNFTFYKQYRIQYIESKKFVVTERDDNRKPIRSITIYDTQGFFQTAFVKGMESIGVLQSGTPEYETLVTNKAIRGTFSIDYWSEMVAYNELELDLLVKAMDKLRAGLLSVGIDLRAWHGAGAIASKMYDVMDVSQHLLEIPDEVMPAVYGAYFGGRIECLKIGEIGEVHTHDIRSAYPAVLASLPSMKGGTWIRKNGHASKTRLELNPFTLYRVMYAVPWLSPVRPFPYRDSQGSVAYPSEGHVWVWHAELEAAIDTFGDDLEYEIKERWTCEGVDLDSRPFQNEIVQWYNQRREFKANDMHAEQMGIKLGLNSMYGKLAQGQFGYPTKPKYQHYAYAGLITSGTRAKLLQAVAGNESSIVAFATDGIFSTESLDVNLSTSIGGWDTQKVSDFFMLKSGMYTFGGDDGIRTSKARGVRGKNLDWNVLRELWRTDGMLMRYSLESQRFVTFKSALVRANLDTFCTWEKETHRYGVWSNKYHMHTMLEEFWREQWQTGKIVIPLLHRFYSDTEENALSEPYKPKRGLTDDEWLDIADTLENEFLQHLAGRMYDYEQD